MIRHNDREVVNDEFSDEFGTTNEVTLFGVLGNHDVEQQCSLQVQFTVDAGFCALSLSTNSSVLWVRMTVNEFVDTPVGDRRRRARLVTGVNMENVLLNANALRLINLSNEPDDVVFVAGVRKSVENFLNKNESIDNYCILVYEKLFAAALDVGADEWITRYATPWRIAEINASYFGV